MGADAAVSMAYRDHHAALFAFLRRATRDEAAAEDLLQETFIRLLTVVREGRPPEQVGAWLYRVASNLVISRGRRATTAASLAHAPRPGRAPAHDDRFTRKAGCCITSTPRSSRRRLPSCLRMPGSPSCCPARASAEPKIASAIGRTEAATRTLLCRSRTQIRARMAKQEADR